MRDEGWSPSTTNIQVRSVRTTISAGLWRVQSRRQRSCFFFLTPSARAHACACPCVCRAAQNWVLGNNNNNNYLGRTAVCWHACVSTKLNKKQAKPCCCTKPVQRHRYMCPNQLRIDPTLLYSALRSPRERSRGAPFGLPRETPPTPCSPESR